MWPVRPIERLQPAPSGCPSAPRHVWACGTLLLLTLACNREKSDSAAGSDDATTSSGGADDSSSDGSGDGGSTGGGSGSDGGGSDGGGSSSGDGEHAYFTRVFDDVYVAGDLETRATVDLVAGPDGFSGTIAYTETISANQATICNTTLNVVRVATDPDCEDCEWGYTFFVEPDALSRTTGCVFASPTTSFGLGAGGYLGTISKRAEGPAGTRNVVTMGTRNALLEYTAEHTLYAEDSEGRVLVDAWDPSSGAVSNLPIDARAYGTHLWQTCNVSDTLDGETSAGVPTGGTEVNDGVDCSLGPGLVDVWETEVAAGQTLLASVDHSGDDSIMWLVDPKGCLIHTEDDSVPCSDDRVLCPAIQHLAAQDGTFRVVVGPLYCINSTMNYYFDGAVQ